MAQLSPFQLSLEQKLFLWSCEHWPECAGPMFDNERDKAFWTRCASAILRRLVSIVYGIFKVSDAVWLSAMRTLWPLLRQHEQRVRELWPTIKPFPNVNECLIAASMPPEVEWFTFVRWPDIPVPKVTPAKGKRVGLFEVAKNA